MPRRQLETRERGWIIPPPDAIPIATLQQLGLGKQRETWMWNTLPVNLQRWVKKSRLMPNSVLAAYLRVDQKTVRSWQDADLYPDYETQLKIARFFNVKVSLVDQALVQCLLYRLAAMGYPEWSPEPGRPSRIPPPEELRKLFPTGKDGRYSGWKSLPPGLQDTYQRRLRERAESQPPASAAQPPPPSSEAAAEPSSGEPRSP